jgi:hypothetical protein
VATETLVYPDPPTLTNGNDGNQDYNLGLRFSVDEAVPCVGVRWVRTPDSVAATPNGGTWVAAIWTVVGETRIAFKNFTPTAATDDFDVLFDDPIVLDPLPTLYVVSIFTRDYTFRATVSGNEIFSPSGMMQADEGRLAASGDPTSYPSSVQASRYYMSPIIDLGGTDPETTGTGALTVGASAVVSASKPSSGTAALTATATATRSTERLTAGTAAASLAASASLSSGRTTTGRAGLAAGATAARSTVRTTAGSARVLLGAYGVQVRGGGGPRLVTVGRADRLTSVTRPSPISTTTRG